MRFARFALASLVAGFSSSCLRNFDQFSDGGVADSNTVHYEAPITVCSESVISTLPTRIRVMNLAGSSIKACARANGTEFTLTSDSTHQEYEDHTVDVAPIPLASNRGVGFWLDSLDCEYPSYLQPLVTQDLTAGGTYTLLVTENTFDGEGWRLLREAACESPGHILLQIVNTTDLVADLTLETAAESHTLRDVTGAGIDVSARAERSYVSLAVGEPASMATITVAPHGSATTFTSEPVLLSAGRFVLAFRRTGGTAAYGLTFCEQPNGITTAARAMCTDVALAQR
jgi:hypothetical protein